MFSQRIKLFGGPFSPTTLRKNVILEIITRNCLGLFLSESSWIHGDNGGLLKCMR